ncbi:MAG: MFS transporter [Bacteroidaceae bacterium]|nr:MFS transporter [Bacteroidaceae bacterium]
MTKKMNDNAAMRWTALLIVSVTMMFAYFFTDIMAPLESILTASAENGGHAWTSDEYGFFSGSYGFFNVFLLLLFFGGIVLDKFGIRITGILSTTLMFIGALIKWYAVSRTFEGELMGYQMQVILACVGFATYGVGAEMAGITVTKVIAKWFNGYELALAMGVQVALARIGTAVTMSFSLPLAKQFGGVSSNIALGAALLCIGVISFVVYCVMDRKFDKSLNQSAADDTEESFKFSHLALLLGNKGFWYITVLCVMFYSGVFPFIKFATKIMVIKFGADDFTAGLIPSMLSYGTIFLTPLFGLIYDRIGKGATLMLIGSILLTLVHVVFAIPGITNVVIAIAMMVILGIAFGLVPSAMWPSVPKIIPMHLLGTAYAVIFYIQNIGLSMVPIAIGKINQANTNVEGIIDYTQTMSTFASFGIISIIISFLLLREDKKKGYGLEKPNITK